MQDTKKWSLVKRAKSFTHAARGLYITLQTQPNMWLHSIAVVLVVGLGIHYQISHLEWLSLVITMALVVFAEIINTAFEVDIDLTSPEYHPFARDVKDIAAGAVLFSATVAVVVGCIIFLPKIF